MPKNKNKLKLNLRIKTKIENLKQRCLFYKNDVKENPNTYIKYILGLGFILFCPIFVYFLSVLLINPANAHQFKSHIKDFYFIGPVAQGISSLVTLVLLYGGTGKLYNRGLVDKGGGLTGQTRIYLIATDLSLNFVIGIHYMYHRDTGMGQFMLTCPIALSPLIFCAELLCVYVMYQISLLPKKKK